MLNTWLDLFLNIMAWFYFYFKFRFLRWLFQSFLVIQMLYGLLRKILKVSNWIDSYLLEMLIHTPFLNIKYINMQIFPFMSIYIWCYSVALCLFLLLFMCYRDFFSISTFFSFCKYNFWIFCWLRWQFCIGQKFSLSMQFLYYFCNLFSNYQFCLKSLQFIIEIFQNWDIVSLLAECIFEDNFYSLVILH